MAKHLIRKNSTVKNYKTKFWQQDTEHRTAFTYVHLIQKPEGDME